MTPPQAAPDRCPVDHALELISGRWKAMILWQLGTGRLRHSELRRAVPGVSQRMLTLHLRELERDGLVDRTLHAEVPPRVEYALTPFARQVMPVLAALGHWWLAARHEPAAVRPRTEVAPTLMPGIAASNVRVFRMGRQC